MGNQISAATPKQIELLTHMLGAGRHLKQRVHGYRNHYCADVNGSDYQAMLEMQEAGLVRAGVKINEGRDQYFHATRAGCEAIGLSKAATARALAE